MFLIKPTSLFLLESIKMNNLTPNERFALARSSNELPEILNGVKAVFHGNLHARQTMGYDLDLSETTKVSLVFFQSGGIRVEVSEPIVVDGITRSFEDIWASLLVKVYSEGCIARDLFPRSMQRRVEGELLSFDIQVA